MLYIICLSIFLISSYVSASSDSTEEIRKIAQSHLGVENVRTNDPKEMLVSLFASRRFYRIDWNERKKCLELAVKLGIRKPDDLLTTATSQYDPHFLKFLLLQGANPNADRAVFRATLFSPCGQRHQAEASVQMIETLVGVGADVTDSKSPIFSKIAYTCYNYTPEQIDRLYHTLVNAGAPTDAHDIYSQSIRKPADIAVEGVTVSESCSYLRELLISRKANSSETVQK